MLWIWIAAGAVLAAAALVWFGFVPSPFAPTLIRYRAGKLEVSKGTLLPRARAQVAELLESAEVSKCFFTISPQNKVLFSRQIPSSIHQRLRNVILNG